MADELVRYDFEQAWSESGTAAGLDLVARDSGHWVRYEDYAWLEASCAAMQKALAALEKDCTEAMESGDWGNFTVEQWPELRDARAALTQANGEGGRDGGTTESHS